MVKWEYWGVTNFSFKRETEFLSGRGEQGWELVAIYKDTAYFKRPLEDTDGEEVDDVSKDDLRSIAQDFVETRRQLLKLMCEARIEKIVLPDNTIVEWDENIGFGGELYIYRRGGHGKIKEEVQNEEEAEQEGQDKGAKEKGKLYEGWQVIFCPHCAKPVGVEEASS